MNPLDAFDSAGFQMGYNGNYPSAFQYGLANPAITDQERIWSEPTRGRTWTEPTRSRTWMAPAGQN